VSFRTRLFLAIVLAILVPLGALGFGVRREMDRRLTAEYENRVVAMVSVIESDLARASATIGDRLRALTSAIIGDNRFRLAALRGDPSLRQYLLDYAGDAMNLSGLSMLQIQDNAGRILSSGHFRNQFDQLQPDLPQLLAAKRDTMVLIRARTPEAALLILARVDSFRLGGKRFTITGGTAAERWLRGGITRDPDVAVELMYPGVQPPSSPGRRVLREVQLPYVDLLGNSGLRSGRARVVVTQSLTTLESLRQSVNRWFLVALALTIAVAILGAAWLSARISRPLRDLATKTSEIDLDRLDQSFATDRRDEIGALSRLLGVMVDRLRNSSARLREAERRAAVGELARQVNHDIKNGLAPIRNVLRHFSQVVKQDPGLLPGVFEARRGTLESSVEYLDTLARNYDRLSPGPVRGTCDVNAIVEQIVLNTVRDGAELRAQVAERLPKALGDSLMVRRILENLVGNGLDSVAGKAGGMVTVSTAVPAADKERGWVQITVADNGPGMTRQELDRAFDDFYTTKPGGSGLGLSIVRRLILDLNGTLRIETEPGAGTRVMVGLPSVPAGDTPA
jgi:signal transduction histidine kinase